MTTERIEIILEGSADGQTWKPYEFKYKPGDVNRAPGWVAPYQPRLDWQMWFAALSNYQTNPWFVSLILRLLEGSPDVEGCLAIIPFPNQPPRYIRAMAYEYTFTDAKPAAAPALGGSGSPAVYTSPPWDCAPPGRNEIRAGTPLIAVN